MNLRMAGSSKSAVSYRMPTARRKPGCQCTFWSIHRAQQPSLAQGRHRSDAGFQAARPFVDACRASSHDSSPLPSTIRSRPCCFPPLRRRRRRRQHGPLTRTTRRYELVPKRRCRHYSSASCSVAQHLQRRRRRRKVCPCRARGSGKLRPREAHGSCWLRPRRHPRVRRAALSRARRRSRG